MEISRHQGTGFVRTKENAQRQLGAEQTNVTPNNSTGERHAEQLDPCRGKAAAINAYCGGVLPLESCERLFARHPEWRAA